MDNQSIQFSPEVIGQTGLRHAGGMIDEEYLPELRGIRGRKTYQEMADQCPVSGAVIYALSALFRSVEWSVQASDEGKGEDGATFLEEVLDDMETPIDAVMAEIASMFTFGFSAHEILWKRRMGPKQADKAKRSKYTDGKIGLRGLPGRAQTTVYQWEIDNDTGDILGLWQQPFHGSRLFIPVEKLLLFRTNEARNNPEGRSILRNAYRPWFFKRRIEEIEAIGAERDLAGLPFARIPSSYMAMDASPEEKAVYRNYLALVRNIRRDAKEGFVLPSDRDQAGNLRFEVELLTTGGSRSMDTSKILDRYDRQIAMSVLADFIFLGQTSAGSFALSTDKTALFGQALGAFLKAVAGVFNRKLIPALWELNGMPPETMPKMHFEDVEPKNLAELGGLLTAMSSAGAPLFPDRDLENHVRKQAGLPPAPEEGSDDYALREANKPGMTLGADGKPIPAAAREDAKTMEGQKREDSVKQADHERSLPPGLPPQRWEPGAPGGKKPAADAKPKDE